MKYIKTNKELEFQKLKEFCENSLAYLIDEYTIDDNKIVDVTRNMITNPTTFETEPMITGPSFIFIKNLSRIDWNNPVWGASDKSKRTLNWSDIKDDVIPFLIMLNNKYKVSDLDINGTKKIGIQNLINDELPDDIKIFYIKIQVEL
jgi:hypothetical protein